MEPSCLGFCCRAFDYVISYFSCRNEPGSDLHDRAIPQVSSCMRLMKVILDESAISDWKTVEYLHILEILHSLKMLCELSLGSSEVFCDVKGEKNVKQEEVNAWSKHVCGEMQESIKALKKWLRKVLPNNFKETELAVS